jgi:hypothetical protein
MVFFFAELFGFFAELLFLGAASKERAAEEREKRKVRETLERAARLLDGSLHEPWFRKRRIKGSHQGRDVEVIWLGAGKVEVRCRAQRGVDLHGQVPLLSRLFGSREARFTGTASGFAAWAMDLFRRYEVISLGIEDGALVARARTGLDPERIHDLAVALVELAWAQAVPVTAVAQGAAARAPAIRVQEKGGGGSSASAPPGPGGLRCPFCHDDLKTDAPIVHCAACDAPHHPSCFEEGEGCSIQGCEHRKARGVRA